MRLLERFFSMRMPFYVRVKKVFFVLSTGRCGTKYLANVLNLAPNATVPHEPPPGCERINPVAYELYVKDRKDFENIRVFDFDTLDEHANIYRGIDTEVFGDCYNSIYPFAIPLYHFFTERNIGVKFIHLLRNPVDCSGSILRAEGPHGIGIRKDFGLRAKLISDSTIPAEIAADIWIKINEVIKYEMDYIEKLSRGTTRLARIEDMNDTAVILSLYEWLGLEKPDMEELKRVVGDTCYEVRHSHQDALDEKGIPKNTSDELEIIRKRTERYLGAYGY